MNTLAVELNTVLDDTVAYRLLSDLGRRMYFPKGIVAQSGEAKSRAHRFNATVGMAVEDGHPMILPSIAKHLPKLSASEAVGYAPTTGIPALREVWRSEMLRKNPSLPEGAISLPIVTPGLTAGIALVADLFLDPGDTVLMPEMYWGNYRLICEERRQAGINTFPLFGDDGKMNLPAFRAALDQHKTTGKIVLLLNFPNNPTGYSPTVQEAHAIAAELVKVADSGCDILVVSDDAYFGLCYEPDTFRESVFALVAGAHDRILGVKIDGPTKEEYVWGFRIGFLTFGNRTLTAEQHDALGKKCAGALRAAISNSSNPAQSILLHAMSSPDYQAEKERNFSILHDRYRAIKRVLTTLSPPACLEVLPFNSGYFMSFLCHNISAEQLRRALLDQGIGTISLQDRYLRVAYSSVPEHGLEELYTAIFSAADALSA
jgi:aspartate/methionine/tyrosine aminotransferase